MVAKDSSISGFRDLEGKTVAISGLKSVSEAVIFPARELLADPGFDAGSPQVHCFDLSLRGSHGLLSRAVGEATEES